MSKKRFKDLKELICSEENLYLAYKKTRQGKNKHKMQAIIFERDMHNNIMKLRQELLDETYEVSGYNKFSVHEPKERIIYAPSYRDKIVQHAINNILSPLYNPCFINTSYACIKGKGVHAGILKITEYLKKASPDSYFVKVDIKKFFYSISHSKIKHILTKKIKCKFTLKLLNKIVDSSPTVKGLPLGNLTSQLLANILLNELDQYAKSTLGLKQYIRYSDDVLAITRTKEAAKRALLLLKDKLVSLELEPNISKTWVFPIKNNIDILGIRFIGKTHRLLRKSILNRLINKIKKFPRLIQENELAIHKANEILRSWYGHSKYARASYFIEQLLAKFKFLERDKQWFIIQEQNIRYVSI